MATYKRSRPAAQGGHGARLDNYSVSTEHYTVITAQTGEERPAVLYEKPALEEGIKLGGSLSESISSIDALIGELENLKAKITELEAGAGL